MNLTTINQKRPAAEGSRPSVPESIVPAFAVSLSFHAGLGGAGGAGREGAPGETASWLLSGEERVTCFGGSGAGAAHAQSILSPLESACLQEAYFLPSLHPDPSILQGRAPGCVRGREGTGRGLQRPAVRPVMGRARSFCS